MTKSVVVAALAGLAAAQAAFAFVPMTAGNLVIYRVGTGAGSLVNTGNDVFVDEYTPTGVLVQSIAMPNSASGPSLIASGTATSEGLLSVSENGRYISVTGYNAATGGSASLAGTSGTTVNRTVAVLDAFTGTTSFTLLTDLASGNNPRSAVAGNNGTDLWVAGGAGGVRYTTVGSTTSVQLSTTVTNIRQVNIFNGQLYNSDSSGTAVRIGAVGSGTPTTSGQTITNIPGYPAGTGSPYAFYFADLSASVAGVDTLYVADDAAGLLKYSLVGGSWTANGIVGAAADAYRGVTGVANPDGSVSLFAIRKGGSSATGGGEYVSLTDASGYNGAFAGSPTLLVTLGTTSNMAFRGIGVVVPAPGALALVGVGALMSVRRRRK